MSLKCQKCSLEARNFDQLALHYRNAHNDVYNYERIGKCDICLTYRQKAKRFKTQAALDDHFMQSHNKVTGTKPKYIPIHCMCCDSTFDTYSELKDHY